MKDKVNGDNITNGRTQEKRIIMPHWPLQAVPGLHSDIFCLKMFGSSVDLAGIVNGRRALCHVITFPGISDCKIPRAVDKVKVSLLCFSLFPCVVPMDPAYFSFLLTC